MTYSINLSGHGADVDDVKEIFETTVRALRAVTPADAGYSVGGSAGGSGPDGASFTLTAADVLDLETVDPDEDADGDGDPDDQLAGNPPADAVTEP